MRIFCYLPGLLFLFTNLWGQTSGFPVIDEGNLPGVHTESIKTYGGSSLYGYINGGAELYKEYGFSELKVHNIVYLNSSFTIEIYRMTGKEEAFGIFSVSRFNCNTVNDLSRFTCQTPYQLQICSGSYYINIINGKGNEADLKASQKIAEVLLTGLNESFADFTGYFPDIPVETVDKEAVLVKGNLGVMNGVPELCDFLPENARYTALVLKNDDDYLISLRFLSETELVDFAAWRKWNLNLISSSPVRMPGGETVTIISANHLLVRWAGI